MSAGRRGGLSIIAAMLLAASPVLVSAVLVSAVLVSAVLVSPAWADGGDAAKGRRLAEKHCARCHVVGSYNANGGIGSTPSLQWIKKLPDWRDRFRTFYARRPHLAFIHVKGIEPLTGLPPYATPVELTQQDADDILAFIETLPVPQANSTVTPLDDDGKPAGPSGKR